jgi:hypothetical protein
MQDRKENRKSADIQQKVLVLQQRLASLQVNAKTNAELEEKKRVESECSLLFLEYVLAKNEERKEAKKMQKSSKGGAVDDSKNINP